jgi:hypothetical protein
VNLSAVQLGHARTIRDQCKALGLPVRALVIALETALDESELLNLANVHNPESLAMPHDGVGQDHGSVGLFQQQPGGVPGSTANWGTTAQCMTPATSAVLFLRALSRVNWQSMTNWQAAQRVQVSNDPSGSNYERYDADATALAADLWSENMPITDADAAVFWTHDLHNGPGTAPAYEVLDNTQAAVAQCVTELAQQAQTIAAQGAKLDRIIAHLGA